jgi:hypothetical protein
MRETPEEQNLRLKTAYQKISTEGRNVLDQMVGRLAEIHWANAKLFFNPETDRKRSKKQDFENKSLPV